MVSLNTVTVVYSFRIQEQFLRVRFCNIPGYFLLNSFGNDLGISSVIKNDKSVYVVHRWLWTINSYRRHNLAKFCWLIVNLQFVNYFCKLLGYFLFNQLSHTLGTSSVIKNDKSVYEAQVKHILNFPCDFRKL